MDSIGGNNSGQDDQDRREAQRRLRLDRVERQARAGFSFGGGNNNNNNNLYAQPEEAPSMGNAAGRGRPEAAEDAAARNFAAAPPNRAAAAVDNASNNPKLNELLQHLLEFCRGGKPGESPNASAINMEKARNVLEACAGNVAVAGQLYWDDYLATQQHQHQAQDQHPNPPPLEAPSAAIANPAAAPGDAERRQAKMEADRIRRRLESDFERLLPPPPPEPPEALRAARRRRRRKRDPEVEPEMGLLGVAALNNRHNVDDEADPVRPPVRPRQVRRPQDDQALLVAARAVLGAGEDATEASVSVSDDEAGVAGVLRMVREGRRAGRRRRRSSSFDDGTDCGRARNALSEASEGSEGLNLGGKNTKAAGSGGDGGDDSSHDGSDDDYNDDDDEDAYISDNDWLFTAASREPSASAAAAVSTSQPAENLRAPLRILWGGLTQSQVGAKAKVKQEETGDNRPPPEKKVKLEPNDDEGAVNQDRNDEVLAPNPGDKKLPEIPSTWLHASFAPDATAMGLAVKDPKPEDVAEHSFKLHQISNDASTNNARRNNGIPLPYHCKGITAVLSIVTAMILTGTSVQSQSVTCTSSRVPFLELSEEERKREFEGRLIDALSSLIQIAAKSSMDRKKKAMSKRIARKSRKRKRHLNQKREPLVDDEDTEVSDCLHRGLDRRLRLCPATWWKETSQGVPIPPEEQWEKSLETDAASTPRIQLSVTYGSNIDDIRSYVLSNMQSFTAPGGVALFLEAIVGIHGEGAVKRMMRKSRHVSAKSSEVGDPSKPACLVNCTCRERHKEMVKDSSLSAAERRKMTNSLDTTPPGHECVSIELISLLLTGKIYSSLKGWSANPLGFGILSSKPGEVGRTLSRPEFPVWCVRGVTCYSVLYLDHTFHGENLDQKAASANSIEKGKPKGEEKKAASPSKPKAAPCMKIAACSSTSRSRDLAEARGFATSDQPGYVANLGHWNPWYGIRNRSGFRLITAKASWSPPQPSVVLAQYRAFPKAKHSHSLSCEQKTVAQQLRERRLNQINVVSSEDEPEVTESPVDEAAMKRVRLHPDDSKFYPKQHRLWRFDMGEPEGGDPDPNSKPRGDHWVPYYSLSRKEQMVVETKFGPQINRILWTRWPGANIDKFTPEGKKEPLPVV